MSTGLLPALRRRPSWKFWLGLVSVLALVLLALLSFRVTLLPALARSGRGPQVELAAQAASGATILFESNNGQATAKEPLVEKSIPALVLHRNGVLTGSEERTLFIRLSGLPDIGGNQTVNLRIETQQGDPDAGGGSMNRLTVWEEQQTIHTTTPKKGRFADLYFAYTFTPSTATNESELNPTPTGYYRLSVTVRPSDAPREKQVYETNYAFLLENQWYAKLPVLKHSDAGAGPKFLVLYYTDMTPFQAHTYGGGDRLPRAQVTDYIRQEIVPRMVDIYTLLSDNWGFSWDPRWTGYRSGIDPKTLTVALTDADLWYHGRAPQGGYSSISINVHQLDLKSYSDLTDWILSIFSHELFHNQQRNLSLHKGGLGEVEGAHSAWEIVTEGTALLVESITRQHLGYLDAPEEDPFFARAQAYFAGKGTDAPHLNTSITAISPYEMVVYWRFLFEQCGKDALAGGPEAAGLEFIHYTLEELYVRPELLNIEKTALPDNFPNLMDQVFSHFGRCPYTSYPESLIDFARSIYNLRLTTRLCAAGEDLPGCQLAGKNTPSPEPPAQQLVYQGVPIEYRDQIASSFGIDLVELQINDTSLLPLRIGFRNLPGSSGSYNVQFMEPEQAANLEPGKVYQVNNSNVLVSQDSAQAKEMTFILQHLSPGDLDTLGIVITRLDEQEQQGSSGRYELVIEPFVEPTPAANDLYIVPNASPAAR
jgi:hypothetical protein